MMNETATELNLGVAKGAESKGCSEVKTKKHKAVEERLKTMKKSTSSDILDVTYTETVGEARCDDPKISTSDVNVFYANNQAIHDVNLDVGRNEVIALIGPSGCGKSTFLRCLNRMNDTIDICRIDGQIHLDGQDTTKPNVGTMLKCRGLCKVETSRLG